MQYQQQAGAVRAQQNYNYGACMENGCSCPAMIPIEGCPDRCAKCSHDNLIHINLSSESSQDYNVGNGINNQSCPPNNINSELNSLGYPVNNEVVEYATYPDQQAYFNQKKTPDKKLPVREIPPPNTIWFYNRNEKYYEFTNFQEGYPIVAALVQPKPGEQPNCKKWPTSEHLFQAAKFKKDHPEICEHIRLCKTARDALNMARQYQHYVDPNWQDINVQVMEWVVSQKFEQHPVLASMLISTGDLELVEHTEVDSFWGDGGGKGRNELGQVLMRVRKKLRERAQFHPEINAPINVNHAEDNSIYMISGSHTHSSSSVNTQNQFYSQGLDSSWVHLNNLNTPPPPLPPRNTKRDLTKYNPNQLQVSQQQIPPPQQSPIPPQSIPQQQLMIQQQSMPPQQPMPQQQPMSQQQSMPQQQTMPQQQSTQQQPLQPVNNKNDIIVNSNNSNPPSQYNYI
ncbi:7509_t:CDS:2 [Acaulospora morrowiae]|uniref:7509_t:CDS:1 n=1 Tax=Acaulospora morrowiae TaxID=94023 RepID=A0A9N8VBP8_9GLOM|nr:7509_t:CDS:2 [Acaulospora morrowiae]